MVTRGAVGFVAVILASSLGAPSASSTTWSEPDAPQAVQARIFDGQVQVSWTPVESINPPVTHYIVHAGAGSCPVVVPARVNTARLPVVVGQRRITAEVQAVNAYGISGSGVAGRSLHVGRLASTRYRAVQILDISDFHGAISSNSTQAGAGRLVTALRADRRATRPTFTVSAGDNIGGSPMISSAFEDLPAILALNAMGVDVSTFGNHEHDRPLSHLRRMIDASEFQWTVANYNTLAPLQGNKQGVEPYTLIKRGGITVGFVGMNTEDTPAMVRPDRLTYAGGRVITIDASVRSVQRQVNAALRAGADLVVVLLHQGWEANIEGQARGRLIDIASQLRGAAVIFGAHTHQSYASVINDSAVVQPANSGRQYARTQVCLDTEQGRTLGSWPQLVEADSIRNLPTDPVTQTMVDGYQERLAARMDEVVGVVDSVIEHKPPRGGTLTDTALGNLITDAMREAYGTEIAFLNIGGVRDTLPASTYQPLAPGLRRPGLTGGGPYDVTLGDVLSALPFHDDLATTSISGRQIWESLEAGQASYGANLFMSGLSYRVDTTRPLGSQVIAVTGDDGRPIPQDATLYEVALPAFLLTSDTFPGLVGAATVQGPLVDVLLAKLAADRNAGRSTTAREPRILIPLGTLFDRGTSGQYRSP